MKFKKGEKVEMVCNVPYPLILEPRPIIGRVTNVDGELITVRPRYKRYLCEFYSVELKKVPLTNPEE